MNPDVRAAALFVGILFCLGLLAMTAVVVSELELERFTLGSLLLIAFVAAGVGIVAMILIALITALRNPPDDE